MNVPEISVLQVVVDVVLSAKKRIIYIEGGEFTCNERDRNRFKFWKGSCYFCLFSSKLACVFTNKARKAIVIISKKKRSSASKKIKMNCITSKSIK